MSYYVIKRYFLMTDSDGMCAPFWLKTPHWNPVRYDTWQEALDAYIQARWRNSLALGVRGCPAQDIDILFEEGAG